MPGNSAHENRATDAKPPEQRAPASDVCVIDVLPQHRFEEERLWRYLQAHLPDFSLPASLRQFQGGQSNPTFLIETATKKFVLRKKPPGKLLPSAHLVEREYRILRALPAQEVPIPPARLLCEDPAVIGTAFYVMDHVEGRVITGVTLPQLSPTERAAVYADLARVAAKLHAVDFRACGLGDFGKPEGYVARQLERWTKQYVASRADANPDMDALIAWLMANQPTRDETAIAHGDFRIGNAILHPTQPRIIALLDWELATLGHPLSDVAYACMFYHMPQGPGIGGGLEGLDLQALGIPAEQEFLDSYCRHSGRTEIPDWTFFLAFSFFRMAAITQGVYSRALQGNAADERAIGYGAAAKIFAAIGRRLAHGG
jgi:aminoglycoside phosphotransferase (APT) family kinase protein